MILDKIQKENDIQNIEKEDLPQLAGEIREFLIQKISENGGHLGSNLGVVELTMALHLSFHLPEDKMIWDVGHQSYTHKLLTGRRDGFDTLRKYGGMSGFPKRKESPCDAFDTGHSSTSISAGLGLAMASQLKGEDNYVISVIGDGSLTGGMAWEALNNASRLKRNYIIVLNDNNMSIAENVGGFSEYLNQIRTKEGYQNLKAGVENTLSRLPGRGEQLIRGIRKTKNSIKQFFVPGMLFEEMGLTYLGPYDGHNIDQLTRAFREAKQVNGAVLVHVCTQKGQGYEPAMRHPARFHGAEPFVIETGLPKKKRVKANYTDIFSTVMRKMGDREPNVVAVTAAMPDGTGLKRFRNMFPDRFFDVGIAEQHAVTFAAGLAAAGLKPVVAVYSSFLQRAYDQVIHDVCIQNLPVIFAIDRAGLVGSDGETHQGIFDLSYMSSIPNMCVMAPKNKWELSDMMKFAVHYDGPISLRYPRGEAYDGLARFRTPIEYGKWETIYDENEIALLAVGSMVKTAVEVRDRLREMGYGCTLVNARFVKPLDQEMLRTVQSEHNLLVTMEENVKAGGFGEAVLEYLNEIKSKTRMISIALPDDYVEHGNVDLLKQECGIDAESIVKKIVIEYIGLTK
ncbi:1-deoxy-D-xylulose-5-phosphate synthase [uncultured Clostridium sp.]|uniref:1-deoxy-D-xylulose-5-phosphate synthase n=1 Tax=Muricoprocola aceti TaxID=2981772 RepID=A0ABT2SPG2_9FIRM|nr:1-deoxy-D-xylulose-5-phosphate synthase [Muricoprocola aceti]MCI7226429.1 1-deoxy-D-xylulose-5-phosphate synthase [Lachnospiraceae bacterium]MCQ4773987.1 1-deoxy-D-xylulose-5-phosphate synthase [Lacrimispora saccharolytica]SCH88676.1 1-deoxy-D-xylulose-5-phosphate synthase [uncultured Clostridium sp.]MCU6726392.1 1-deoxy-D-xylulose-5-phosphate synthase [Muricoprocola aceti]MDD7436498.1 1-deoxy-D-xylulose-5-phosphate synthase [Lachnospiraceae bacterium]